MRPQHTDWGKQSYLPTEIVVLPSPEGALTPLWVAKSQLGARAEAAGGHTACLPERRPPEALGL